MHNPYEAKLAALAVSFVAVTSVTACNNNPQEQHKTQKPPQPQIAVNPAPPPPPKPTVNPAPISIIDEARDDKSY